MLFFKSLFKSPPLLSPLPTNHTLIAVHLPALAAAHSQLADLCLASQSLLYSCFIFTVLSFRTLFFYKYFLLSTYTCSAQYNVLGTWDTAEGIQMETSVCSNPRISCLRTVLAPPDWQMRELQGRNYQFPLEPPSNPFSPEEEFSSRLQQAAPTGYGGQASPPSRVLVTPKSSSSHRQPAGPQPPLNVDRGRPQVKAPDWGYFRAYTFHPYLLQPSFQ